MNNIMVPAVEQSLRVGNGVVLFVAFLVAAILLRAGARAVFRKVDIAPAMASLGTEISFYVLLAIGLTAAMSRMGIPVGGVVAGLGLSSFVVGFALRDALSNMLAGLLTLMYRPFDVGDKLTVAGLTGNVVEINLRYTILKNENVRHLIPNQMVFSNPVQIHLPMENTPDEAKEAKED